MPIAVYVPSRITEFIDVPVPGASEDAKALTYDHDTGDMAWVAFEAAGAVAAHAAASDPHTGYLLADGSRAGAASQRQVFTNGVTLGTIRPASDSTTAVRVQNAAGSISVFTVNTVAPALDFTTGASTGGRLLISQGPTDNRYVGMWAGSAASSPSFANYSLLAIDTVSQVETFFNAPGSGGKLFFRQNNITYMSIQSGRICVSTSQTAIGDGTARLTLATDNASKLGTTIIAHPSQTADLQDFRDSSGNKLFAVGPAGQLKTNQSTANTNTPAGATARQLAIYNETGTLLGYVPIYGSAW